MQGKTDLAGSVFETHYGHNEAGHCAEHQTAAQRCPTYVESQPCF